MNNMEEQKNIPNTENNVIKTNSVSENNSQGINNNVYSQYATNNVSNNNQNNKDKKQLAFLRIAVVILCLVCVGIIAWTFKMDDKKEQSQNTSTEETEKTEENKSNIELQHTQTSTSNFSGTYMIDVSEVVENVMPSIVAITSKTLVNSGNYGPSYWGGKQYATGAGSGIIVSKSDTELLILTNKHVIEDAEQLSVKFIDDKSVDATVKGASTSKDIAIISIKLSSIDKETLNKIKIATIGNSKELKVGQGVIAIGNALGYGQSVTVGVISALDREVTIDNSSTNMIQIDAAINGGNSGGALLNSKGEVIGINSAKFSSSAYSSSASIEGMGFAIPISDVEELIKKLMNGENLTEEQRGYLGVSGYIITNEDSQSNGIPTGFYISSIVKNSGSDKAGLSIGNIITEVDGNSVKQFNDISEMLETKKAGEKVKVKIKYASGREYKEKELTITLSSYKEVN